MNRKAIIFGLKGYRLTNYELKLFKITKPWGIILFSRNIKNINQLKLLIDSIKILFKDKNYPILIDQEGGRVSRLNKIIDLSFFSQKFFSKFYKRDKKLFSQFYKIYINAISDIFKYVGININTVPVLDIYRKKSHKIIGNRSFSKNPNTVTFLGNFCVNLYKNKNIATMMKHIPGHGMSKSDSHHNTPIVRLSKTKLINNDFKPFLLNKSLFAMTAHIIYSSYDKLNTATHSKIIINSIIRNHMKFKGILISDDISMKSLKYNVEKNAIKSLKAGCNIVMHCNANINEMRKLSKIIPRIDKFTQKKIQISISF